MSKSIEIPVGLEGWNSFIDRLEEMIGEIFPREVLVEYLETPGMPLPDEIRACMSWVDASYRNTITDLMNYFSTPEKPVDQTEMSRFWFSLSFKDRVEFKTAVLD